MKEFKGTPGPWVYAANSAFFDVGQDHRLDEPGSVMAVYPSVCIGVQFDQEDDARLIAAAPDLLAALQAAWAAMDRETACGSHLATERHMARKAIAKALGEDCD